jgi:hypothetical protein
VCFAEKAKIIVMQNRMKEKNACEKIRFSWEKLN